MSAWHCCHPRDFRADEQLREVTILHTDDFHKVFELSPLTECEGAPRLGGTLGYAQQIAAHEFSNPMKLLNHHGNESGFDKIKRIVF